MSNSLIDTLYTQSFKNLNSPSLLDSLSSNNLTELGPIKKERNLDNSNMRANRNPNDTRNFTSAGNSLDHGNSSSTSRNSNGNSSSNVQHPTRVLKTKKPINTSLNRPVIQHKMILRDFNEFLNFIRNKDPKRTQGTQLNGLWTKKISSTMDIVNNLNAKKLIYRNNLKVNHHYYSEMGLYLRKVLELKYHNLIYYVFTKEPLHLLDNETIVYKDYDIMYFSNYEYEDELIVEAEPSTRTQSLCSVQPPNPTQAMVGKKRSYSNMVVANNTNSTPSNLTGITLGNSNFTHDFYDNLDESKVYKKNPAVTLTLSEYDELKRKADLYDKIKSLCQHGP